MLKVFIESNTAFYVSLYPLPNGIVDTLSFDGDINLVKAIGNYVLRVKFNRIDSSSRITRLIRKKGMQK